MNLPIVTLVLFVAALAESFVYNVMDNGALGDGSNEDSEAFKKAWQLTCGDDGSLGTPTFYAPAGKIFSLKPSVFSGPCKPNSVQVQIDGNLTAPISKDGWVNCASSSWLSFKHVKNLIVTGAGTIDGQGQTWWNKTLKHGKLNCDRRPKALFFLHCDGLVLNGLNLVNSPRIHISMNNCSNATLSNFHIVAPEDSPNTDGIDITASTNISIYNSSIQTGDDCIAINSNTSYVDIARVACGPGHGISIGSLGEKGEHATVEHVYVRNCSFSGAMYGARIKTCQGGSGIVRNVVYEDIILENTRHPIIIDQFYKCPHKSSSSRKLATQDLAQLPITQGPARASAYLPISQAPALPPITPSPAQAPSQTPIIQAPAQPPMTQAPTQPPATHAPTGSPAEPPQPPTISNLMVDEVTYSGIRGTSSTTEAITLNCDQSGCTNITMYNVNITASIKGKILTTYCNHVSGKATSTIPIVECLSLQ